MRCSHHQRSEKGDKKEPMINVRDQLYDALKEVTENVSGRYPKDWAKLPAVQLTEEENRVAEWTGNHETHSYLRFRIDVWSNQSISNTCIEIDRAIAAFGLKRTSCGDVADPSGLNHKLMRYECYIDCDNERVYHEM